jgi:4-amino-4-deoxy-L-arabinose transferase-like glycosyltransferase
VTGVVAASGHAAARRQALWLFGLALVLRLAVVAYAATRFPPADDGSFYHTVATRIAAGHGYTWAWPDGVVTYAAHYPVGYPALLGASYALFGAAPWAGMILNALLGALLVAGVHDVALRIASLGRARLAGLVLALHPTLVLYTAAIMTELAAAAVLVLLVAVSLRLRESPRQWWQLALLGTGGALLVAIRSQLLPLVPLLGAVAVWQPDQAAPRSWLAARARGAALVLVAALACLAPWTARNCAKMDGCVFVSANGGWNLLIGTLPEAKGSFAPIAGPTVPSECREVYGEAGKDRCFGQAGVRRIREAPLAWLGLVPQKLAQLFNGGAIAASYLNTSNPQVVNEPRRRAIATLETLSTRLLLLGAALGLLRSARRRWGQGLALLAAGFTLSPWGFAAQLAVLGSLAGSLCEQRNGSKGTERALLLLATALLGLCFVTHMVFFGAARYALVWLPWLAWLVVLPRRDAARGASRPFDSRERGRG